MMTINDLQDCIGMMRRRRHHPKSLASHNSRVYSQNGEDGIISEIFRRIEPQDRYFVEIGTEDGVENNTRFLLEQGWSGVWIDTDFGNAREVFADYIEDGRLLLVPAAITAENVNQTLASANVPMSFDFLSLDIDQNTSHVWRALNRRARVVCIEYNASIPPSIALEVVYDPTAQWDRTNYFGGSLKALEQIGIEKSMNLVGCDITGINAFFVGQDETLGRFQLPFTAEQHWEPPRYGGPAVRLGHPASQKARHWHVPSAENKVDDPFDTQKEIRKIFRLLRPYAVQGFEKARFGCAHDGGYVLIDDFHRVDTAFSLGIASDISWDTDIADRGLTVYQFDHTVDSPCHDNPRLIFTKKKISPDVGPDHQSLAALIEEHDKRGARPNLLLKIDIECSEWDVLDNLPSDLISRFTQIVGEFHYFEGLTERGLRQSRYRVLKKLTDHYAVVHVHANNYGQCTNIANVLFPNVLEITFANRNVYSFADSDEIFPGPLDSPNNPAAPDIYLGPFRF